MHVDYAKEVFEKMKSSKWNQYSDLDIIKCIAIDEIVDFAKEVGNEKICSICSSMQISSGYRNNSVFNRKKITEKQRYSVAKFLIDEFLTAKTVIAKAFKFKEEDW